MELMTLDEHIKKAEEDAAQAESNSDWGFGNYFIDRTEAVEYAENCRQLAEWLKDYKRLLEKESDWIPVSERVPEDYRYVLVSTDAEEVFIALYLGKMNDGTDCFDDDDGMMWVGDIVAWMPLPQPYKAESEEI